ncbi:MAG: hemoglobin/transferrin/lactoferrin receptor protein, partial [Nonlabens sp.]
DVIVRQAGLAPNGDTILWIPSEGEFFDVQQNVNADDGSIYGGSANMLLKIGANWNLSSSLSYTKGRVNFKNSVIDTLVPMAHIPPIYGQTSLLYTKEKIRLEVVAKYNMKKPIDEYSVNKIANVDGVIEIDKGSTPDNAELGIAYTIDNQTIYEGTYAWATFNLYGAYAFNAKFSIDIAVENITDIHYRHFASGVSAPGRNFIVSFRGKF